MKQNTEVGGEKTALITGASGGIGLELVKLFAKDGYNLVLVARSEDKLHRIAEQLRARRGIKVHVITKDLSQASSPQEVHNEVQAAGIRVDVLVNNAGFASYGKFPEISLQHELELLQTNIVTLTHLTKLFLPPMIENGSGRVLNLASTAAFQPGPLMAVYYASKAYVLSFSEAIANELKDTGVTVTALCPGPTRTGFQARASMEGSRLVQGDIAGPKAVALAGYRGIISGKTVVIPGTMNRLFATGVRFLP